MKDTDTFFSWRSSQGRPCGLSETSQAIKKAFEVTRGKPDPRDKRIDELERSEIQLIKERDYWEEKATELANDIGSALGFDVGEHSNLNCPVQSAIDGLYEMRSQIEEWRKDS